MQKLVERVKIGDQTDFTLGSDGILRFRNRVVMPKDEGLRKEILEEAHRSKFTVHPGGNKMYQDLKSLYWWKNMKKEIAQFVQTCLVCQQVKAEHQKPSGLLQPLEIPEWKWENITMDFVSGLPRTQRGHDAIWVIVDRLTKSAHFLPINMKYPLEKLARLYLDEIIRLHGIPVSIVSDRDPRFVSRFWQKMQEVLGTKLNFSTTYHPQTDGQSERTIQTLEDMLRTCVLDFGENWSKFLTLVEFAYNNSFHSSIQMAPYEALYGRKCRSPICWDEVGERKILDTTTVSWIEEANEKVKLVRQRIQTAQSRQKSYADNRRKDLEFTVGDMKLQPRFVGPYKIIQRVGNVAYKLELPPSLSRIHNVFHVSMLKKYHPDPSHVLQPENIEIDETLTYEERPVKLLDRKVKELRNKQIPLVKVLWKNHGVEEATWEVEETIRENRSLEEHLEHLKAIFEVLRRERLYANLKKCTFCTDRVVFLGYVVSAQGIHVDEEKIKSIQEWPTPTSEMFALVRALETWQHYLRAREFVIKTDHESLKHLKGQQKLSKRHARWVAFIESFPYVIKYKTDGKKKAEFVRSLHDKVRTNIERRTAQYVQQANKHRRKLVFEPGDWVWLHLRKERFPNQRKSKLSPRGDGPFQVIERINDNAYRLDLPGEYNERKVLARENARLEVEAIQDRATNEKQAARITEIEYDVLEVENRVDDLCAQLREAREREIKRARKFVAVNGKGCMVLAQLGCGRALCAAVEKSCGVCEFFDWLSGRQ
ncbi:uncharacterized protein [Coffea arabica]|uniref:Integrase catalytic domain-containing protein n=1 Tax=Coffea arabica TaxID=13443 RepID=A0ABM4UFL0_COFAR